MSNQAANRQTAIGKRRTTKNARNKALGVKGFYPGRSQSRGGKSISVSFTILPHLDRYISKLASEMEMSRSGVIRLLVETYRLENPDE